MRAKEIITELSRPKDRVTAHEVLTRAGYRLLGNGSFASVYQKPGAHYVLKLFDADDHAYMAFLSLVAQHPNPHFPKFFGKSVRVSPGFSAVRMEPLGKYRGDPDLLSFYVRCRDIPNPLPDTQMRLGDADELFYELPDLKVAIDLLIDHLGHFRFDIRQDNIMSRGSQLVITDPVVTHESTNKEFVEMPHYDPEPEPVVLKPRDRKRLDDILSDDDLMRELGYGD